MSVRRVRVTKLPVVIGMLLLVVFGCGVKRTFSATTEGGARIVQTRFPTGDVVIADVVVTDEEYGADNKGIEDSTIAIIKAIDDVSKKGGGTVYLPAGEYLITRPIDIKPFVTLRGDYQDPDEGNEYGTVIIAKVVSSEQDLPALFTLGGSAGVMGLTVYYPEQDINNVKPYPFTFYVPGGSKGLSYYMLQSIANCTVINGYKGLGATVVTGVHEMMTIENFKGTFLHVGIEAYNSADVGTCKNIRLNNDYWARAGAEFNAPPKSKIDAYTREYGTGLVLGDLEWTQFVNVSVSDYNIGVHVVAGKRAQFAGAFFDLSVENCNIGLKIDKIDPRWGMVVANSKIAGNQYSIFNFTTGYVKVAQTELVGPRVGRVIFNTTATGIANFQYDREPSKPISRLYNVVSSYGADKNGKQDASQAIQKSLNDAGEFGGGVVYLEAGFYKVTTPLEVPANVELRGASSVANRDQSGLSKGTIILSYYGDDSADPGSDIALITLNGDNAGVRGLRIVNPLNSPSMPGREGKVKPYPFAIRGKGASVYAVNIGLVGIYNGIDFRNCNNHYIKKVVGTMYNIGIIAGNCSGGYIEGVLYNGTVVTRQGLSGLFPEFSNWPGGAELFSDVIKISRRYLNLMVFESVVEQTVLNCFAYGAKDFINAKDSELLAVNIGADNLAGYQIHADGGNTTVVNMMRWNGSSYKRVNKAKIRIYNRATIDMNEDDVVL